MSTLGGDLHPIQVVVRRTGISADVLRAWERRHHAVTPTRSTGSRRLYSDEDIERLLLMRKAIEGGRSIGQIAALTTPRLREMLDADAAALDTAPDRSPAAARDGAGRGRPAGPRTPEAALASCLAAVQELDIVALETEMTHASVSMSPTLLVEQVIIPLMQRVGDAWQDGRMRIVHEHLASALVRTLLGNLARNPPADNAPELLGATPQGQRHEFGALTAVATAVASGWSGVWLGSELPALEIAAAVERRRPRAIALGLTYPAGDPRLREELLLLHRHIGATPLLVGGDAAPSYEETLREIGAFHLSGPKELRDVLRTIAAGREPRKTAQERRR